MGFRLARALLAICVLAGGWCLYHGIRFDAPEAVQRAEWDQPGVPVFTGGTVARMEAFASSLILGVATLLYIRKAAR